MSKPGHSKSAVPYTTPVANIPGSPGYAGPGGGAAAAADLTGVESRLTDIQGGLGAIDATLADQVSNAALRRDVVVATDRPYYLAENVADIVNDFTVNDGAVAIVAGQLKIMGDLSISGTGKLILSGSIE